MLRLAASYVFIKTCWSIVIFVIIAVLVQLGQSRAAYKRVFKTWSHWAFDRFSFSKLVRNKGFSFHFWINRHFRLLDDSFEFWVLSLQFLDFKEELVFNGIDELFRICSEICDFLFQFIVFLDNVSKVLGCSLEWILDFVSFVNWVFLIDHFNRIVSWGNHEMVIYIFDLNYQD